MIGDMVEVVIDTGTGGTRTFEISATRAGRRVDVSNARGIVEVAELTRTGHSVRVGRFMATRVIAIVEHPMAANADSAPRRRSARVEQEETLLYTEKRGREPPGPHPRNGRGQLLTASPSATATSSV
jgi:hypothetical protein